MKKSRKGIGQGKPEVPFFRDPIVSCLDLVFKVDAKIPRPNCVLKRTDLFAQICFDLAVAIRDRVEANFGVVSPKARMQEGKVWIARSPEVRAAYRLIVYWSRQFDRSHKLENQARQFARANAPDRVLRRSETFVELWKQVTLENPISIDTNENLARKVELIAMTRVAALGNKLAAARDDLLTRQRGAPPRVASDAYGAARQYVFTHYNELFDFRPGAMMEHSDVSPRIALLDEGEWISHFWETAQKLGQNPREFSPESFALRRHKEGQSVLTRELDESQYERRKSSRAQAFLRWAREQGCLWGISAGGFNYHTKFTECRKQDERVSKKFQELGFPGLREFLAADKRHAYCELESVLKADLLAKGNQFDVLAERLWRPPWSTTDLSGDIAAVFGSKARALRRIERFLPIFDSNL